MTWCLLSLLYDNSRDCTVQSVLLWLYNGTWWHSTGVTRLHRLHQLCSPVPLVMQSSPTVISLLNCTQSYKLDESTARRQLKSPRSLSGRSIHLTLVTKWLWSWSWMTYCHPLCVMSIGPPILRYSYFKILPWKSMVKVMCVVSGENSQKLYEAANNYLNAIAEWLEVNRLLLNVKKTHHMVFSNTKIISANNELKIEGETISEVTKTKFLGVIIDNRLNWQHHINFISSKVAKGIGIIIKVRKVLDNKSLLSLYYAFIYPYLMYCYHVWENACSVYLNKLNVLQKKVVRFIAGVKPRTSPVDLFHKLNIMKVNDLNIFLTAQVMYQVYTSEVITVFQCLFSTNRNIHTSPWN